MTTLETRPTAAPPAGTPYDQRDHQATGYVTEGSPAPDRRAAWRAAPPAGP